MISFHKIIEVPFSFRNVICFTTERINSPTYACNKTPIGIRERVPTAAGERAATRYINRPTFSRAYSRGDYTYAKRRDGGEEGARL